MSVSRTAARWRRGGGREPVERGLEREQQRLGATRPAPSSVRTSSTTRAAPPGSSRASSCPRTSRCARSPCAPSREMTCGLERESSPRVESPSARAPRPRGPSSAGGAPRARAPSLRGPRRRGSRRRSEPGPARCEQLGGEHHPRPVAGGPGLGLQLLHQPGLFAEERGRRGVQPQPVRGREHERGGEAEEALGERGQCLGLGRRVVRTVVERRQERARRGDRHPRADAVALRRPGGEDHAQRPLRLVHQGQRLTGEPGPPAPGAAPGIAAGG